MVENGEFIVLWAPPKAGKTSFIFSCPRPTVLLDSDLRAHCALGYEKGMLTEEVGGLQIHRFVKPINWQGGSSHVTGYYDLWCRYQEAFVQAMEDPNIETVAMDTVSSAWRICFNAYLDEENMNKNKANQKLGQIQYTIPNDRMRALLGAPYHYQKRLVVVYHEKPAYKDVMVTGKDGTIEKQSIATGEMCPDGFKPDEVEQNCDLFLRMDTRVSKGSVERRATVLTNSIHPESYGLEIPNPTYDSVMDVLKAMKGAA